MPYFQCNNHRCFYLLYLSYGTWVTGLIFLCLHHSAAAIFLCLTLMLLGLYFWSAIRSSMFIKKSPSVSPDIVPADAINHDGPPGSLTTIIGEGTVVEGNILSGMNADVYGQLTGDITLPDGTVRVMPGGHINGTIVAAGIVIGGDVDGCCEGQSVTVLEQGGLRGVCRSTTFSIKPGGVFTGTSETLPAATATLVPAGGTCLYDRSENESENDIT
ncbi:polymer-forming cytoskeletal protein [Salmonella enterica]|nr:polymer-forming cytoskeletal protein [Salmonella enterica]